jgi:carbonic anhydrase/acetyltransferase-like protein (isoleucine patch superfamily)
MEQWQIDIALKKVCGILKVANEKEIVFFGMGVVGKLLKQKFDMYNNLRTIGIDSYQQAEDVHSPELLKGGKKKYYVIVTPMKNYSEMERFLIEEGYVEYEDYCCVYKTNIFRNKEIISCDNGNQVVGSLIDMQLELWGEHNSITIGNGVVGNGLVIVVVGDYNRVIIGENCIFQGKDTLVAEDGSFIQIGAYAKIGNNVYINSKRKSTLLLGEEMIINKRKIIVKNQGSLIMDKENLISSKKELIMD